MVAAVTDTKAGELAEVIARVRERATDAKASRAHLDAQTGRYSGCSVQCVLDVADALTCAEAAEMGADYGKALVLSRQTLLQDREQHAARVAQLEAELKEAKADAERFRWLEENGVGIQHGNAVSLVVPVGRTSGGEMVGALVHDENLRDAIDAARREP